MTEIPRKLSIWHPADPTIDPHGKPYCAYDDCHEYDGKRCGLLGHRPDAFCEPAIAAIVKDWKKRGGTSEL